MADVVDVSQIKALAKDLRKMGDKTVGRRLGQALKTGATSTVVPAIAAGFAEWSKQIPSTVRVKGGGVRKDVTIQAGWNTAKRGYVYYYEFGGGRHPLWGKWVAAKDTHALDIPYRPTMERSAARALPAYGDQLVEAIVAALMAGD